jgi:hypothetical protein
MGWVGVVLLVAVLLADCWGALYLYRLYRQHRRFYVRALVTEGVVVASRKFSSDEGPSYLARVFYTVAGTEYMLKEGVWTQFRRYKRGQAVPIHYLPEFPGSGRIADSSSPVILACVALVLAAHFVYVSWLLLRFSR